MPDFVTASNGFQRYFTKSAREPLRELSNILCYNRLQGAPKIKRSNAPILYNLEVGC